MGKNKKKSKGKKQDGNNNTAGEHIPDEYKSSGPKTELGALAMNAAVNGEHKLLDDYLEVMEMMGSLSVNEQDEMGLTALHFAVSTGDLRTVKTLVEKGGNANVQDTLGFTPLFWATGRYPNPEMAEYLITEGNASVSIRTAEACTALHGAVLQANKECVKLLLKHGADPRAVNKDGTSPIDLAQCEEVKAILHKSISKKNSALEKTGAECANCGNKPEVGLKRCGRCHVTLYCGRDCQIKHWKTGHKEECKGFVMVKPVSAMGRFSTTINYKKRTVYMNEGNENNQAKNFLKNQFVVKVQVPFGGTATAVSMEMMVYNEDRSVHGFIDPSQQGAKDLIKRISDEGYMGIKAYFWAELTGDDDGSFKVYHGKRAPFQSW